MQEENDILVSIITVCYNSGATIERTIKSVLSQTYQNYEYIIIDGQSIDETMSVISLYEKCFNGRLRVISEPDKGIYDAMNKGISMAKGKIIGIVNSDDYYEENAIATMISEYKVMSSDYIILYGFQRNCTEGKEESVVLYHHDFINKQMITHPTCFVTKKVYEDFGVFNTKYKSSADYEFMLRIYHEGKVCFRPVYKIITNFQTGGMSSSQIGYRETAGLQYKYGTISIFRYFKTLIKSYMYELMHKRK